MNRLEPRSGTTGQHDKVAASRRERLPLEPAVDDLHPEACQPEHQLQFAAPHDPDGQVVRPTLPQLDRPLESSFTAYLTTFILRAAT